LKYPATIKDIKQMIGAFQKSLNDHLPALEAEINDLVQSKNQEKTPLKTH
jgi:hypothetical protein